MASDVNQAAELIRKKCSLVPHRIPRLDTSMLTPSKYVARTTLRAKKSNFRIYTLDCSRSPSCRRSGRYYTFYINWRTRTPEVEGPPRTICVPVAGILEWGGIVTVRISRCMRMRSRRLGLPGCHCLCGGPFRRVVRTIEDLPSGGPTRDRVGIL